MDALAQFAVLTIATIFAGAVAFGMAWAFLRGAFHLMAPAAVCDSRMGTARGPQRFRAELVPGTRAVARQLALDR
jgi:hypothetical protein